MSVRVLKNWYLVFAVHVPLTLGFAPVLGTLQEGLVRAVVGEEGRWPGLPPPNRRGGPEGPDSERPPRGDEAPHRPPRRRSQSEGEGDALRLEDGRGPGPGPRSRAGGDGGGRGGRGLRFRLREEQREKTRYYGRILGYWAILGLGWGIHTHLRNRQQERRTSELELRASRLEKELVTAQLSNLRDQIRPHFLFNTLHSIGGLIRSQDTRAPWGRFRLLGICCARHWSKNSASSYR